MLLTVNTCSPSLGHELFGRTVLTTRHNRVGGGADVLKVNRGGVGKQSGARHATLYNSSQLTKFFNFLSLCNRVMRNLSVALHLKQAWV